MGLFPDLSVFCVADGMGGHEHGEIAAAVIVQKLPEIIHEIAGAKGIVDTDADDAQMLWEEIAYRLHRFVREEAHVRKVDDNMGATFAGLQILNSGRWITCHVGDARVYQIRQGQVVFMTRDHRPRPGIGVPKNAVLQAMGVGESIEPDISSGECQSGDTFILCSDGFWQDAQEGWEAELGATSEIEQWLQGAVDAGKSRGGADNSTAVLVRIVE